jgi:hypothetical protein
MKLVIIRFSVTPPPNIILRYVTYMLPLTIGLSAADAASRNGPKKLPVSFDQSHYLRYNTKSEKAVKPGN